MLLNTSPAYDTVDYSLLEGLSFFDICNGYSIWGFLHPVELLNIYRFIFLNVSVPQAPTQDLHSLQDTYSS